MPRDQTRNATEAVRRDPDLWGRIEGDLAESQALDVGSLAEALYGTAAGGAHDTAPNLARYTAGFGDWLDTIIQWVEDELRSGSTFASSVQNINGGALAAGASVVEWTSEVSSAVGTVLAEARNLHADLNPANAFSLPTIGGNVRAADSAVNSGYTQDGITKLEGEAVQSFRDYVGANTTYDVDSAIDSVQDDNLGQLLFDIVSNDRLGA